jgi:hypothetical protein
MGIVGYRGPHQTDLVPVTEALANLAEEILQTPLPGRQVEKAGGAEPAPSGAAPGNLGEG